MSTDAESAALCELKNDPVTRRVVKVGEAVGEFIEYWGFKAIHGRLWTLLALRAAPMSQTEIAGALGVSRSLVCSAVAELTDFGLVRATSDHRNAPYEAVMDFWPTIADVLRTREWMLIESARTALEAAVEEAELSAAAGQPRRFDIDRMKLLLAMTKLGQTLLRVLIAMRLPRGTDHFAGWAKAATSFISKLRAFR